MMVGRFAMIKLLVLSLSLTGDPRVTVAGYYQTKPACEAAKSKVINRLGRQLWKGCVK